MIERARVRARGIWRIIVVNSLLHRVGIPERPDPITILEECVGRPSPFPSFPPPLFPLPRLPCSLEAFRNAAGDHLAEFYLGALQSRSQILKRVSCDSLRELAENAPTTAWRFAAARAFVGGCPDLEAAAQIGSRELQVAAARKLAAIYEDDTSLSNSALMRLATTDPSQGIQLAAALALGFRWEAGVSINPNTGNPVVGDIDLIKFAFENFDTVLGYAVIAPITRALFGEEGGFRELLLKVAVPNPVAQLPLELFFNRKR